MGDHVLYFEDIGEGDEAPVRSLVLDRTDLVAVEDPVIGPIRQQAPFPRFIGRPTPVPTGAPTLGADNRSVWCDLVGLSDGELAAARRAGTI